MGLGTAHPDVPTPEVLWPRFCSAGGLHNAPTAGRTLAPHRHLVGIGPHEDQYVPVNGAVEAILMGRRGPQGKSCSASAPDSPSTPYATRPWGSTNRRWTGRR
jgi:hypothetical protein